MTLRSFVSSMCSWLTMGPGEDAPGALEKEVREWQGQPLRPLCHRETHTSQISTSEHLQWLAKAVPGWLKCKS